MEFILAFTVVFSSVQSLSRVRLFVTSWIAARQASLFITIVSIYIFQTLHFQNGIWHYLSHLLNKLIYFLLALLTWLAVLVLFLDTILHIQKIQIIYIFNSSEYF